MELPIDQIITELSNSNQPLLNTDLAELSDLDSEQLKVFTDAWAEIVPERRQQIICRLVELAEDNVELNFDSIFKHGLKDPDEEVRSKAIEGLWENEELSLLNPLVRLLEQDSSEKVRVAATVALGKFATLAEHKKLSSDRTSIIQEALLKVINDDSRTVEVRRRALEAIAPLNLPQVKTAIQDAYESHIPEMNISSIYAMGKNCDPSWLPTLLKELTSTDAEVRYEAAGACGELEEEAAIANLVELLKDADTEVQMAAIQALGKIGGNRAREYLQQYLNDDSEAISQAAAQALNDLNTNEGLSSFKI